MAGKSRGACLPVEYLDRNGIEMFAADSQWESAGISIREIKPRYTLVCGKDIYDCFKIMSDGSGDMSVTYFLYVQLAKKVLLISLPGINSGDNANHMEPIDDSMYVRYRSYR